jgi:hypothetical protein
MRRTLISIALAGGAFGFYSKWLRPRMLRWGSTTFERHQAWTGDEFMPDPASESTHAINIDAPTQHVWRWLAQIGQDRGGFYSYTPLENLAGADIRNTDNIHLEWQHRYAGERLWLATPSHYGERACMVVARWVPAQSIVLVPPSDWDIIRAGKHAQSAVWSFHLVPCEDGLSCRLIARSLTGSGLPSLAKAAHYGFWEPAHFFMEMAMLRGIRRRAETSAPEVQTRKVCA